jgi:hypothetical protein
MLRSKSDIEDYPVEPMISGTMAAGLFALLFLTATVGAIVLGFWASGASPETTRSPVCIWWFGDEFASISFMTIALGLVCGLGTPLGLLIGFVSFISFIGFLRSQTLHVESFFALFLCGVTAGFRIANAVYQPFGVGSWRILVAIIVPIILYLAIRIPGWAEVLRHPDSQRCDKANDPQERAFAFFPICHGKLDMGLLVAGTNSCSHCGCEFQVEVE